MQQQELFNACNSSFKKFSNCHFYLLDYINLESNLELNLYNFFLIRQNGNMRGVKEGKWKTTDWNSFGNKKDNYGDGQCPFKRNMTVFYQETNMLIKKEFPLLLWESETE